MRRGGMTSITAQIRRSVGSISMLLLVPAVIGLIVMAVYSSRTEAMIRRAYDYKNAGTTYKICKSQAPGQYADCSGLVMQCLYAAGFDPAPATPAHHARPENEFDSRTLYNYVKMRHVSYSEIKRGDLIFYRNEKSNTIIHVAIYLGDGKVIESWPPAVTDKYGVSSYPHRYIYGVARPFE